MIEWLISIVPIFKIIHIAAIMIWCGAIIALPLMLARHSPTVTPGDHAIIRRATHSTYILWATPAAVVAVISGTWLIFLREVFVPWFFGKLAIVAILVAVHAWIGHILTRVGEDPRNSRPPHPLLSLMTVSLPIVAILALVLAKPPLGGLAFPEWLLTPRGGQLPFDVPSR